jgi:hypothetical protein
MVFVGAAFPLAGCSQMTPAVQQANVAAPQTLSCLSAVQDAGEYRITARPSRTKKFLVFDVNVTNISNEPIAWVRTQIGAPVLQHGFKLTDDQGRTFALASRVVQGFDPAMIENQPINPGASLPGKLNFDVPRGSYIFTVVQQLAASNTGINNSDIFTCSTGLI